MSDIVPADDKSALTSRFAALTMDPAELQDIIQENLGSMQLGMGDLDQVKVPSGGGTVWTVPSLEGEIDVKELDVIIVGKAQPRVYWSTEFTGETVAPDCSSNDGITGKGTVNGLFAEERACASCPMNAWGSDPKGKGKACRELWHIYALRDGDILPFLLSIPRSSNRNMKDYFRRLTTQGIHYSGVVTKFSLERVKSEGGINYSQVKPTLAAKLTPEEARTMRVLSKSLESIVHSVRVTDTVEGMSDVAF